MIIGVIVITAAAHIRPQSNETDPAKEATATDIVRVLLLDKTRENKNSFQEKIIDKIPADIRPGRAKGKAILKKVYQISAPSTLAASSISMGMWSKKDFVIQTLIGKMKLR